AASGSQLVGILDQIATDLAAGAIGIGVIVGYTPGVDPSEYLAGAEWAASAGVPPFTHSRDIGELAPAAPLDGADALVRAAQPTRAGWSSQSSSTKPIRTTSPCCDDRSPFRTRSLRATPCRPSGPRTRGRTSPSGRSLPRS